MRINLKQPVRIYLKALPILFLFLIGIFCDSYAQKNGDINSESLYYQGVKLMDSKNIGSAREAFEDYLDSSPQGFYIAEASYYRAYCALILYHKDGEKLIEDFVKKYPVHPKTSTAYYELGKVFYKSRNSPKTIDYLLKADLSKLSSSQREEAVFMLGYSNFNLRRFSGALPYFNQLKSGSEIYSGPSSYYAGYIEYESGKFEDAVNDFSRAEKTNSYATEVPYMKTASLFKLGRYDDLLSYTSKLFESGKKYSNEQQIYLFTAESYFLAEKYSEAEKFYSEFSDLNRGKIDPDVQYRIAYSQYALSKYDEALDNFKIVASGNDEVAMYSSYYLGILYYKNGNSRYALTAFDKVRSNKFSKELQLEGEYQYGKLCFDIGDDSKAISSMEYFVKTYPDSKYSQELSELLSEAYLSTNDYEKAIKQIELQKNKSQKLLAAYQKANYLAGTVYFNKGDYRRAVDLFEKSLENPISQDIVVNSLYWSAEAYSVGKRYVDAQTRYLRIINNYSHLKNPYIEQARYGLGYTYYNSSNYEKAREQFNLFINAKPKVSSKILSDAYVRMADCYYVKKNYEPAISGYQNALKINSSDSDYIYLQLGMVNALKDNTLAASGFFDRVISHGTSSPYFDDALFQRAQLSFNKTEYKESIQLYTKLINSKPSSKYVPYALVRRASAFYNLGQKNQAIVDYEKIFSDHIRHEIAKDALIPIQELLTDVGRSDDYDKYLAMYKVANPDEKGLETIEFETSRNQYFNQNYGKAIGGLKMFVVNYPVDPRKEEAIYYIGDSYFRLAKYDSAGIWLKQLKAETSFWQYPKVIDRLA
ncbi:MAG: tetratricopeptide repeat protein, partial [Cyclobacteriaceae bacterium]|nr:tetratricopeptide repeat protein [Cyclobacteriaceae bacterium]